VVGVALKHVRPKSREAWRAWLQKHHAVSPGVWLIFAKKHTKLPSLSYADAVEEALCFGWIDSLMKSIDDQFHRQMFTPRKAKSVWSALNRARVARLTRQGQMAPAGLAAMALARTTGMWHAHADIEALVVPPELQRALDADPDAKRHWPTYSESARKGFLFMLANARRPETRDRRAREIVDLVSRKVSMTELRKAAMTGTRPEPRSPARRKRSS
jgi:uncharacterized protein YdeI (YjbR/CyaY-like superfamily)